MINRQHGLALGQHFSLCIGKLQLFLQSGEHLLSHSTWHAWQLCISAFRPYSTSNFSINLAKGWFQHCWAFHPSQSIRRMYVSYCFGCLLTTTSIIDPINVLESWSFAAEALPTLARLPEASMLGLRNGSVYDIVQGSERGNESIVVNSTSYHASCGLIPNATNYAFNKNDHIWNIEAMYEDYSFYIEVERICKILSYRFRTKVTIHLAPEVIKVAHVYEKGWDDKPNTCNQGQTFLVDPSIKM